MWLSGALINITTLSAPQYLLLPALSTSTTDYQHLMPTCVERRRHHHAPFQQPITSLRRVIYRIGSDREASAALTLFF